MKLKPEHFHAYFQARLGRDLPVGRGIMVRCPFHDDKTASLSIDASRGIWKCFAGCGSGGAVEFEEKFSRCDHATAWANIEQVCGMPTRPLFGSSPEAVYSYKDEDGNELFQKVRNAGKHFTQRVKLGNGDWSHSTNGVRRVLYNLPSVVTANAVFIAEGEKDCDNLASKLFKLIGLKYPTIHPAATTNPDGAERWRSEYAPYLTGKHVVIFSDNDDVGRAHAQTVAASVRPFAVSVKLVELPGLPPKGDVSDYLEKHGPDELLQEVAKTDFWAPTAQELLIPAPQFLSTSSPSIDWTVDPVIQRGSNGFLCSYPKVGKSWLAADLAIALALGTSWIGFQVPRSVRTALITREDNPKLTKWRMDRLLKGRSATAADLDAKLFINSREQSPDFKLDDPTMFGPMVQFLKTIKPEFVILDVFNIMHRAEENDNTEMAGVMRQLSTIQREVGCALCVVHHFSKTVEGSLTQRLRGASAIAGWAEWLAGIETIPGSHTRKLTLELKAGNQQGPVYYEVDSSELDATTTIHTVDEPGTQQYVRKADAWTA